MITISIEALIILWISEAVITAVCDIVTIYRCCPRLRATVGWRFWGEMLLVRIGIFISTGLVIELASYQVLRQVWAAWQPLRESAGQSKHRATSRTAQPNGNLPQWSDALAALAAQFFSETERGEEEQPAELRSLGSLWRLLDEGECARLWLEWRWADGECCPVCGDANVKVHTHRYNKYYRRYICPTCTQRLRAETGDNQKVVTFSDKTGTIFEQSHLEMRQWFWIAHLFTMGQSTALIARELAVEYETAERAVRLLQGALFTQRDSMSLQGTVEGDEVYITAGLKGRAGGQSLNRPPRRRGLKQRGRGTYQSDRPPVLGLVQRGQSAYFLVLANVQGVTIRPFIERLVTKGVRFFTDCYVIYLWLPLVGYLHDTVNHSQGEWARGEIHCNTAEGIWSLLRDFLRRFRGVSKVYLPFYVVVFEFLFNRRRQSAWEQTLDLFAKGIAADGPQLRRRCRERTMHELCPIPGLAPV